MEASQTAAQAAAGPSIQITQGTLTQVGDDLRLALRFSRAVPVDQLQVSAGRVICAALDPRLATDPIACTQRFPAAGEASLLTRSQRRPAFAKLGRLRLRLLATGDSMIQIVDSYLAQRLERRRKTSVRSDARVGTGISKPAQLDWVKKARRQAGGVKPDVTVMSIGANDGFPMRTPSGSSGPCCGAARVMEYARRVESMMRSYRRGARSRVYWLTLPVPRSATFAEVFRGVNEAVVKAARSFPSGVRVLDMAKVFTPGGAFRRTMVFRGRKVNVRQSDGIHLSSAGASIAATLIIERLRADRLLPRLR